MAEIILKKEGVEAFERWQNTKKWVANAEADLRRHKEQHELAIRTLGNFLMPDDAPVGATVLMPLLNSFLQIDKISENRTEGTIEYRIGWWNGKEATRNP